MNRFIRFSVTTVIFFFILFACKNNSENNQNKNRGIFYPNVEKIKLPRTGQVHCYNYANEIIPCEGTGQDGELRRGVAWPKPRFIIHSNGTITDRLTGLMWEQTPLKRPVNWYDAFKHIEVLKMNKFGGYKNWRMPNINELFSLVNFGYGKQFIWLKNQGFNIIQEVINFWSSTTDYISRFIYTDTEPYAYVLSMFNGCIGSWKKNSASLHLSGPHYSKYYVIGVRTASQGVIKLPKTGQTKKYHVGDDGALLLGVTIPKPRFIDNGNGTMTDRLTGLMWEKKPSNKNFNWNDAFNRIKELNLNRFGGYNDWRLPNIRELLSLVNYETPLEKILKNEGFQFSCLNKYWSNTTETGRIEKDIAKIPISGFAWFLYISNGAIESRLKVNTESTLKVFAVRGGS